MAESSGETPPDDPDERNQYWTDRINGYFASPEAQQHFLSGFQGQQGQYLDLQGFKERERKIRSTGHSVTYRQGELRQGGPSGEKVTIPQKCRDLGHAWASAPVPAVNAFIVEHQCSRCGVIRMENPVGKTVDIPVDIPKWTIPQEMLLAPIEPDPHLICIWCGKVCDDLEALDTHEEECEPA
jgi:hypothetical protein